VGHVDTKSHNHAAETSTIPPSERGRPSSVVIAGAGIIGLTTAWRLRRRGIEVTVLDDAPVSGASFAAAGMLAPVSEVIWDQPTLYPLMVESGRIYRDFAAAIAHDVGHASGIWKAPPSSALEIPPTARPSMNCSNCSTGWA